MHHHTSLKGRRVPLAGEFPAVGTKAPDFRLVATDLSDHSLSDYSGRMKLLSIVPSLDTEVCATSTKTFDQAFSGRKDAICLIVSADLPFAAARFCSAEGIEHAKTLSMMRSRAFAKDYGVLIEEGPLAGITARAVVVVDGDDNVLYTQLVPEITDEPDYQAALQALG